MDKKDFFSKIWKSLQTNGYETGDDILYFEFVEACDDNNIDPDSVNLDEFCEKYGINIG